MTDESATRSRGERDLAYGRLIAQGLRPVSAGLVVLYAGLSAGHVLLTHEPQRFLEAAIAGALATAFLGLHLRLRLRPIDPGRAELLAGATAFLALAESLAHLAIAGDSSHSANLRLLLVAVGAFLLSRSWLIGVLASGILGWAVIAGPNWDSLWAENAITLGVAALLALVIQLVRRRGLDALVEERRRFGALIEHGADLIGIIDTNLALRFVSPSIETLLGYGPRELIGRKVLDYVHPADVATAAEHLGALVEGPGTSQAVLLRLRHKAGPWRILETIATSRVDDPALRGLVFNARDVTERETLGRSIREATEHLAAIVLASPMAIVAMDLEGFVTMWNPAAERIFGWTEPEALGRLVPWLPKDHMPEFDEFRRRLLAGEGFTVEHTHSRKDGSPVDVRISAAPTHDADGRVVGIMSISEDVTERVATHQALREAEARYRALVEQIPAVLYLGEETRATYVGPQIEAVLGVTVEEWVGDAALWRRLVHPDDLERVLAGWQRFKETREPLVDQYRMVRPDGRIVWIEDRVVALPGEELLLQGVMFDVTERKEAEERLRQAELQYRTLVEHLPTVTYRDEVAEDDPVDATPAFISPQIETLLGYTPEEWVADIDLWGRCVHPDDLERVETEGDRARVAGEPFGAEYRMIRRDGRQIWVREESVLVRDEDGRPRFWQGTYVDVTERREAADALRSAEARYRVLVEQIPAVMYVDRPGHDPGTEYVSPRIEEILGVGPEEYTSDSGLWERMLHPDDHDRVMEDLRRYVDEGFADPEPAEYRLIRPDGRVVWISDVSTILRDDAGQPAVLQGLMLDITERKHAEEELHRAEERYRTLVEGIPAMFYVWDARPDSGEQVRYVSPQVESLLGFTPEEWMADPAIWDRQIHPDDLERVRAADLTAANTGVSFEGEYRMLTKGGRIVWVHDQSLAFLPGDEGEPLFSGLLIDVTALKTTEEALREAEVRLRTLVEQLPAALYVDPLDENLPDVYVSPQIEDILGVSRDVYASDARWWQNHLHPDDRERMLASYKRIIDTSITSEFVEYRVIRPDGKLVWIEDRSRTLFDERGNAAALQGIMFDITAKKRGEALRDGQRRVLELIATGAPVEEALEALVAVAEEQTEGAVCSVVLLEEGGERLRVGAAPSLPEEYARMIEGAGAGADSAPCAAAAFRGEPVIVADVANDPAWEKSGALALELGIRACWSVPIAGPDGKPLGAFAIFEREARGPEVAELDVAEAVASLAAIAIQRRRDEEAVRESLDRFRTLASQAPVGIIQTDARGGVVWVNDRWCEISGLAPEEALGDGWIAAVHPEDRARVAGELNSSVSAGSEFGSEYRYLRSDGTVRWVADVGTALHGPDGSVVGYLGTETDITERKAVEEVLRASEAELQRSLDVLRKTDEERQKLLAHLVEMQEQERDRMAEGIEDEHLQQMTAVGMRLETLRRAVSDPEQLGALDNLGESVSQAVARMRAMLNELRPRELETVGLGAAVERYLGTVAAESGLEARVEDRQTAELSEEVRATAFRIAQDAVRNVQDHAGAARVEVALEDRDGGVLVRVVDDGRGFAIGEGDGPDRLGLAAMRERAEMAGGWLRVRSAPGAGTTVELWLPAEQADGDASVD